MQALGAYWPFRQSIRQQRLSNVSTFAHEVGHYISEQYTVKDLIRAIPDSRTRAAAKAELVKLGKALYGSRRPNAGYGEEGIAEIAVNDLDIGTLPATRTQVMLNLANPAAAFRWWRLPADGVGLARMEFVVANAIRVHPMALLHYDTLKDAAAKAEIATLTAGYPDKAEYFVDSLARGD